MNNTPAANAARLAEEGRLAETLGRFTLDTIGFDRDALLFQAGQASVHPRRLWPMLAGLLAMSQAATLLFFLTRSPEQATPPIVAVPGNESPSPVVEPRSTPSPDDRQQLAYRRALLRGDLDNMPMEKPTDTPSVRDKVLTVLSISSVLSDD
jgi:hypothetical protein